MAARKPLVMVNGQLQQLPAGDTLNATVSERDMIILTNSNAGAIVIGNTVYVSGSGACDKSRANAGATQKVVGLVGDVSVAPAASANIQTDGIITATTVQWDAVTGQTGGLTPGADYYLSDATAGNLTTTAPTTVGSYVRKIGTALSSTEFEITIGESVLL